jgi:hypothetical protein
MEYGFILKNVYSVYIHEMGNAQLFCISATNIFLYQIKNVLFKL